MNSEDHLGYDQFAFEADDNWAKLPLGWSFKEASGVAVNSRDEVHVLTRGAHPIIIFSKDGEFLRSWGEGVFAGPHGIAIGKDDSVFVIDSWDHTVRKFSPDGRLLMTVGTPGYPAAFDSGKPFNKPTHLAVDEASGDLFVTDGYSNARVHRFTAAGVHLDSWGRSGSDPGEFIVPHNVVISQDGRVFVADRENNRIQVFDRDGNFLEQWGNMYRTSCLALTRLGGREVLVVGEFCAELWYITAFPNLGNRVSVFTLDGKRLVQVGAPHGGEEPDQFLAPHGIAVDSTGDIYVAEASWSMVGSRMVPPREMRTLKKLIRTPPTR